MEEAADDGGDEDDAGEGEGETDLGVAELVAEVGDALVLPVGSAVCFPESFGMRLEFFGVFLESACGGFG